MLLGGLILRLIDSLIALLRLENVSNFVLLFLRAPIEFLRMGLSRLEHRLIVRVFVTPGAYLGTVSIDVPNTGVNSLHIYHWVV